jgi:hypothetical protein
MKQVATIELKKMCVKSKWPFFESRSPADPCLEFHGVHANDRFSHCHKNAAIMSVEDDNREMEEMEPSHDDLLDVEPTKQEKIEVRRENEKIAATMEMELLPPSSTMSIVAFERCLIPCRFSLCFFT